MEFADRIRRLPAYPVAAGYDLGPDYALLASNESPFPPFPDSLAAAHHALAGANRYPDPSYSPLRKALAARYDLPPTRIALGNGSCDVLLAAGEALLEPGAEIVYAWPSFSIYPHLAGTTGARAITVPLDAEDRHDLEAILREITVATRMVIVCNPNNPTSTALPYGEIAEFVKQVPRHACIVLDEAYCEFSTLDDPDSTLDLLRRHSNLLLLRTFSKVYGLAGLRTGYGLCGSEELRQAIEQVRQPFYLNVAAQAAAAEALKHQDSVAERATSTIAERLQLEDELRGLGLWVAESHANFVWTHLPDDIEEDAVTAGLKERKVLVRSGRALGRENALRITVGTADENTRLVAALREILAA